MTRVALMGLATRRLRTALTAFAIVLGVALVSGALTLTDTMKRGADSLSEASYAGTDAIVSARTFAESGGSVYTPPPSIPAGTVGRVRAVEGVETAVGSITDEARMVDASGEVLGAGPYFGIGHDARVPAADALTPFRVREGRFATSPGEVVIDRGTAEREGIAVGDPVRIQTRGPAREFEVSGIATFGEVDSIGRATFVVFDLETAQRVFRKRGEVDEVLVAGDGPPAALRRRIAQALPADLAVTGAAADDRFRLDDLKQFVSIVQVVLVAFGGIAVFVGAFTIMNTLSITVTQRSREFATLRTVGASRAQVLRSVIAEALAIGAGGSIVGVGAGIGLAKVLAEVLAALGLDLPQTETVIAARTVIVGLAVGVVVTVLAGIAPALRATRVAPVMALREGAPIPPRSAGRRFRLAAGFVLGLALAVLSIGTFAGGIEPEGRLALLAPGALLLFTGVALVSPRLAVPLASVLGRPAERVAGIAGVLARRNAMRNPGRTAATAAALMIGIALVTFVAVIGQGLRDSTTGSLEEAVRADFVLVGEDGFSPIDPEAIAAAANVPGVEIASGLAADRGRAFGRDLNVDGVDPRRIAALFGPEWKKGSDAAYAELASGGAIVTEKFADRHGLDVGSSLPLRSVTGERLALRVAGVSRPDRFNPFGFGDVTIARTTFDRAFAAERDRLGFVNAAPGTGPALERALARFPDTDVQPKAEFQEEQSAWVDQVLGILYVLLSLAVVISLLGIVNTLALSVLERTRELGMLKVVGMTRRQLRRMIRHETIVTALIGAALGIAVGLFLAALATTALGEQGLRFGVPVGSLAAFTVVTVVAGSLAAILPARRAVRIDPLRALQYE